MIKFNYFEKGEEERSYLAEQRDEVLSTLSQHQKDFISDVTNGLAKSVASLLINKSKGFDDSELSKYSYVSKLKNEASTGNEYGMAKEMNLIKEVTDFELPENTVLFRASRLGEIENLLKPSDQNVMQLHASTNEVIFDDIKNQLEGLEDDSLELITIYAHKGVKGLFLGKTSGWSNQSEYLIAPNNYYRFLNRGRGLEIEMFATEAELNEAVSEDEIEQRFFGSRLSELISNAKTAMKIDNVKKSQKANAEKLIGTKINNKKRGNGVVVDYEIIDRDEDLAIRYNVKFEDGSSVKWNEQVMYQQLDNNQTKK